MPTTKWAGANMARARNILTAGFTAPDVPVDDATAKARAEARRRAELAAAQAEAARVHPIARNLAMRRIPWMHGTATLALGAAAQGVTWVADQFAELPGLPVACAASAVALAGHGVLHGVVHFKNRTVVQGALRRRLWTAGTVSAVWVALAATAGMSWVLVSTLLVLELVISRGWYRDHPLQVDAEHVAERVDVPQPRDTTEAEIIAETFGIYVAGTLARASGTRKGGRVLLPGARLTEPFITDHKIRFTCELVRGEQTLADAKAVQTEIATALGVYPESLFLERRREEPGQPAEPWKIWLTIVTSSPVAEPVFWERPILHDTGSTCEVEVGRFADGDGRARWILWNSAGCRNGAVIGGTRSGKGGVSGVLVTGARATGRVNTIYVDPQDGMSSPPIADRATITITGEEWIGAAIEVVESIAQDRQKFHAKPNKLSKIVPTPEMPAWLIWIDEADTLFEQPGQAELWKKFTKRCLKLGMFVIVATQYPGLTAFGGNEHLRSSVAQNYIALKTQSQSSKDLLPGLTQDPCELPDGQPGFGYFGGKGEFQRSDVPFRADFLPTDDDDAGQHAPTYLGAALDEYSEPPVCALDAAAISRVLGQPGPDGRWICDDEHPPLSQPDPQVLQAHAAFGGWDDLAAQVAAFDPAGNINPGGSDAGSVITAPDGSAITLTDSQRKVLLALENGATKPKDVAAATGLSRDTVHRVLKMLIDMGQAHKPEGATYLPGSGPNVDQDADQDAGLDVDQDASTAAQSILNGVLPMGDAYTTNAQVGTKESVVNR